MSGPLPTASFAYAPQFLGWQNTPAFNLRNAVETATVSATAATGTINYDVTQQSVLYFTSNASANWTLNIRGDERTKFDTLLQVGQAMTIVHMVTQGGSAFYNNVLQIDGTTVTPKYQGGVAWSGGNASSIDSYAYSIVKTAPGTFTVFASQTQFK